MKRGGPLRRTKPVNAVNRKRKAKRAADDRVYGSYHRWVKQHPCAVKGEGSPCFGDVDGHHIRSVGAGGVDANNTVPLCRGHHTEWHTIGPKRFDEKYFNALPLYAEVLYARWRGMRRFHQGDNE